MYRMLRADVSGVFNQISTPIQTACQLHVVVLEENNLTQEFGTAGDFDDSLNQSLTCTVVRVGLTCKQELPDIGLFTILDKTVQIRKQVSTLIMAKRRRNQSTVHSVNLVQQDQRVKGLPGCFNHVLRYSLKTGVNQLFFIHASSRFLRRVHWLNSFPNLLDWSYQKFSSKCGIELFPLRCAPCGKCTPLVT